MPRWRAYAHKSFRFYSKGSNAKRNTRQDYACSFLKRGVIEFSASDWIHPTRRPKQGNTVCLHISGTYEELKGYFDKLSVGADQNNLDLMSEQFFWHIWSSDR